MKKILFALTVMSIAVVTDIAAQQNNGNVNNKRELPANYKYQIEVNSQPEAAVVMCNGYIDDINNGNKRGWNELGRSIEMAYKSTLTQKTVNATSNLVSLGVNYITTMMQKNSKDFEAWSKAKQQQCTYKKSLSSQETIEDFYYRPSSNGALDPRDLKFNGFTCRNFIEVQGSESGSREGHDAFYISCKLRTDSLGLAHLANHSKFMLEVDSLVFYPKYCNIPNSGNRVVGDGFNFNALVDLELELRVKVLSSWINEAVMITNDYELGEFVIRAKIDENALQVADNDTVFIYNGKDARTKDLVNILGDCFIVPRSFVGTSSEPMWGTGQYKLAIDVIETCQLNAEYYIKIDEIGNGRAVNFANLPGYKDWNKEVWKAEWRTMKARKAGDSFMQNAWKEIKTAYLGSNWVKELVDPAVTRILEYETKQLHELLDFDSSAATPARK